MLAGLETSVMNGIADQFGRNLDRYIEDSGLSQEDVADRAEVHRTQISHPAAPST